MHAVLLCWISSNVLYILIISVQGKRHLQSSRDRWSSSRVGRGGWFIYPRTWSRIVSILVADFDHIAGIFKWQRVRVLCDAIHERHNWGHWLIICWKGNPKLIIMKINVLKSFNITYETLYDMSFMLWF